MTADHSKFNAVISLVEKTVKSQNFYRFAIQQCTVVGLSTRPNPLIISKSLQFWILWSQSIVLFMIRCMLSLGSGSKTFGALKVTIYVKFFELSVLKMSNFQRNSACQWTISSGLFAKKNHKKFFCSC